jgi:hypothetical protein
VEGCGDRGQQVVVEITALRSAGLADCQRSFKLTAKGTFTPTGKTPITTTKVFVLKRR